MFTAVALALDRATITLVGVVAFVALMALSAFFSPLGARLVLAGETPDRRPGRRRVPSGCRRSRPTDDGYETVAGLFLEVIGGLPDEGEPVAAHGVTMTPVHAKDGRILLVRIDLPGARS